MTSERSDEHPHADEHGVLSDTGSVETTGIPLIEGGTEHLSVAMPGADDELDDDVVGDEVVYDDRIDDGAVDGGPDAGEHAAPEWSDPHADEPGVESPETEEYAAASTGGVPTFTAEGEIVDDGTAPDAAASTHHLVEDIVDAEEQTDTGPTAFADTAFAASVDAVGAAQPATGGLTQTVSDGPAEPATNGPAQLAPATAVATPAPAVPTPAAAPAAARATDRVRPVERVSTRREYTTLTSKRLGEFEVDRESADLLTADRLLDPAKVRKPEPEGAWQQFVYSITGHRVNLGDSKRARARKALDRRIAAPLSGGARFVPIMSRKGGVGKTTVTMLLGMALADARDDRVIAIDANPDRGTLAERIERPSGKTVRDLVRMRGQVAGYNDLSTVVARDETRLDVVASDTDPRVSEAFSDADYHDVASLAAHYYSIVLTDTGTGIVHSVMFATLERADQLVIVTGLTVDEARLASETLTWLETNGYSEQVRSAVVVLNNARPGTSLVRADELEQHFRSRVRTVVRLPYDPHIAAGSAISFRELQAPTRQAARELAAVVVEGLRSPAIAA